MAEQRTGVEQTHQIMRNYEEQLFHSLSLVDELDICWIHPTSTVNVYEIRCRWLGLLTVRWLVVGVLNPCNI